MINKLFLIVLLLNCIHINAFADLPKHTYAGVMKENYEQWKKTKKFDSFLPICSKPRSDIRGDRIAEDSLAMPVDPKHLKENKFLSATYISKYTQIVNGMNARAGKEFDTRLSDKEKEKFKKFRESALSLTMTGKIALEDLAPQFNYIKNCTCRYTITNLIPDEKTYDTITIPEMQMAEQAHKVKCFVDAF